MRNQRRIMVAVLVFLVAYSVIVYARPEWLFRRDGSVREFGVAAREKTILPLWLVAILLSILAYLIARQ